MASSHATDSPIEIQLTKGQVTVIDPVDADLAQLSWHAEHRPNRPDTYNARGSFLKQGGKRHKLLHRLIMERMLGRELKPTEYIDHIDGDPLNNRRSNLRLATPMQNCQNKPRQSNNTSGYKGVSWNKKEKKYYAYIRYRKELIRLGRFDDPVKAHEAYCEAAMELFGEFANFG